VIRRLQFFKLAQVAFLISPCFHRKETSIFATDRKLSVQICNWMRKIKFGCMKSPNLDNKFGAVIHPGKTIACTELRDTITVAFVESFKEKKPSFTH
jgi:hypothetical protein